MHQGSVWQAGIVGKRITVSKHWVDTKRVTLVVPCIDDCIVDIRIANRPVSGAAHIANIKFSKSVIRHAGGGVSDQSLLSLVAGGWKQCQYTQQTDRNYGDGEHDFQQAEAATIREFRGQNRFPLHVNALPLKRQRLQTGGNT